ncbi:MAG: hydroxyethylthiazole kinase [Legionellaceae bacterium]|nr:hydroxyethylthiazole kinase [Legionellaceae bacterium]
MRLNTVKMIRDKTPLVLFLTNSVTENFCANTLLAFGGSPIMSHAVQELTDLFSIADALVINIGTLNDTFLKRCMSAVDIANQYSLPIMLDPVGAGASKYRTETSQKLISQANQITIKANASEIMALVSLQSNTKGVDSHHQSEAALDAAQILIETPNINHIVITGKTDYVVGENIMSNQYGHTLMARVTGMGCALNGCLAAALASDLNADSLLDVVEFYGLAGEKAAAKANGPGTFKTLFLDELYQ